MYDKASAVVSELIANSYDANAENVEVKIPLNKWLATTREGKLIDRGYEIFVIDDGLGMTPKEVNEFYLKIGTNPRLDKKRGEYTKGNKRKRLGRKGIGKLAPFGICKKMEVISSGGKKTKNGYKTAHIILDYNKINQETDEVYPPDIGELDETFSKTTGTTIKLYDFNQKVTPYSQTFHDQIARRYGIQHDDFIIKVTDTITGESFHIGELKVEIDEDTKIVIDDRPIKVNEDTYLPVKGWIAYAKEPYPNEEVAGIRVYARGKFVANARIFGLRSGFTGEYTVRSYVVGVIHADWVDEEEDLIQSDRQDILWSSEYGLAFQEWGQNLIKELGRIAYPARKRKIANRFLEISNIEEEAKKRFHNNEELVKTAVEVGKILGRGLNAENLKDVIYVNEIKELALGFAPHKTMVDKLYEVEEAFEKRPLEAVAKIFNDINIAEAASLGLIVRKRLDAIAKLKKILSSAPELELQRVLESAPWMIDPRWTVLQANQTFKTLRHTYEAWHLEQYGVQVITTTKTDSSERPDFIMAHFGRNVEIVEIKRKNHKLTNKEFERIHEYYEKIVKFINARPRFKDHFDKAHIVVIVDDLNLTGTVLDSYNYYKDQNRLEKKTWEEVIADTEKVNEAFLAISDYKYI